MEENAPGRPGIAPRWTSSAKSGVGTALHPQSHLWYTLSHGILNEIYYPRVDTACTRDLGMLVTDGRAYFSEEKRHADPVAKMRVPGVPVYDLANTSRDGRYRIEKTVLADPHRHTLLQWTRFVALQGHPRDYRLYVLLAAHLENHGWGNTAWIGDYKGVPMLFAQRGALALALACSAGWLRRSVGYAGVSDGWQDISRNYRLTREYARAEDGNVALTAEIDVEQAAAGCLVAVGFGRDASEAGHRVRGSLIVGFEPILRDALGHWAEWQDALPVPRGGSSPVRRLDKISPMVIRVHEEKDFRGGVIASLSIPWGFSRGDEDIGGYHLVWPRDLVEAVGGLIACGAWEDARRVILYLEVTQDESGKWPQNMWLDGVPYWSSIQMDETAFPILLLDLAVRAGALRRESYRRYWPMVRRAVAYLVRHGPSTKQDRWEQKPGYSTYTLAVEVAALLVASELAEERGEPELASFLRETADTWNDGIERWTYVTGTELARSVGVDGYYVRIAPPEVITGPAESPEGAPIAGRGLGPSEAEFTQVVSPDVLGLVRFGVRAPDDPRVLNTLRVIDATLRKETPAGPLWYRYTGDAYGEHADGSPSDNDGIGRLWPLLTGERGHYELAAGRPEEAERLLDTLAATAGENGLIPEQVWDSGDIPELELFFGRPSGSAMPLVWAHSEFLKLRRSLADGRVFDLPPQTAERYLRNRTGARHTIWRFDHRTPWMPRGRTLRIEVLARAIVHWSGDGWRTVTDTPTRDLALGLHVADLPVEDLGPHERIRFTFRWIDADRWEGRDFEVGIEA